MPVNKAKYGEIVTELVAKNVQLVAVSKIQSVADIQKMYDLGQRDFGENYVQELVEKQSLLPEDIRWHFIGHLQGNKVKYIAPFVHLIQGVDSSKLLLEINKQAKKINTVLIYSNIVRINLSKYQIIYTLYALYGCDVFNKLL